MEMFRYQTKFRLTDYVTDIEEANGYLQDDDMKLYAPDNLQKDIIEVTWYLTDYDSGYIELITKRDFSDDELKTMSDWISGQNSDGLGEGFEQQNFANYYAGEEEYAEDYYDDDWVMASFDWKTNNYILEKLEYPVTEKEVKSFLRVRDSGVTNMLDANKVCRYAHISKPVHLYIISNFNDVINHYGLEA